MRCHLAFALVVTVLLPLSLRAQVPALATAPALQEVHSEPFRTLATGETLGEWNIVALSATRHLFDGRPTEEPCGYTQQITVERPHPAAGLAGLPATAMDRRLGHVAVGCIKEGTQLVAGTLRLMVEPMGAATDASSAPASQPADESAAASQPDTPVAATATATHAPDADAPFEPADPATVTRMPEPINPVTRLNALALGEGGALVEGRVNLEVEVRKDGSTRQVRVLQGLHPTVDQMTVAAVQPMTWKPAEVQGVPVDVVVTHSVEWLQETPAPAAVTSDEPAFYKGELSALGNVQLVNARSSVGLALGVADIDKKLYAVVRPDFNLHLGPFALGLGVPLRFEAFDHGAINLFKPDTYDDGFANVGRFRSQDWDQALRYPYTDLLTPLRYLTWGRKEDNLFVDVNRVRALTIGHGQLVRRYAPNVDIEDSNLFAELDAYGDIGGVELIGGPLPIPRMLGALVFVKPLGLFLDGTLPKSWSIGASYVTDLNAPTALTTVTDSSSGRVRFPVDEGRFMYADRNAMIGQRVQGLGVDTELKVLKISNVDLKLYLDYSHLLLPEIASANIAASGGGGLTFGSLWRLNFGARPVRDLDDEEEAVRLGKAKREMKAAHAMRLRLELRAFDPHFLPSYFNTQYEVDRFQFASVSVAENERATLPTKLAYLAMQNGQPWRGGFYLEASYALVDALAVTAVYEDAWKLGDNWASVPAARNLILHAETQGLGFLQLFATYHYRNFQLDEWGKVLQFSTDNEALYLGGRLQILILAFNLGVQRAFRLDYLDDDAGTVQLKPGGDFYPATSVGQQAQWNLFFDVEIGWQF
ncbi:MAG: energy transducer TonB [Pseudomonadota bacterium]